MDISAIDALFYTERISEQTAFLSPEEMRHAVKVLRKKAGDEIAFTDGSGTIYSGRIMEIGKKETLLEIVSSVQDKKPNVKLTIAVAPTKSFDRMEWCVEKLTEIGVQAIIPLLCKRSEREKWNEERVRKVAISAMKQSKRGYLPECHPPMKFSDVVQTADSSAINYIATLDKNSVSAKKHYKPGSDVMILIGPEGDFTEQEVAMALQKGFVPLSLGEYRLRTETAAVMAAATVQALNQS